MGKPGDQAISSNYWHNCEKFNISLTFTYLPYFSVTLIIFHIIVRRLYSLSILKIQNNGPQN